MTVDRWLVVPRWETFQHRDAARQAVPTWIKLHTRLLSDEAYLQLTPTRRSLLVGIWLEYARTRRALPDDTATLTRRLAQRVLRSDLEALSEAGFLGFSAGVPASTIAVIEEKREEVPPYPPQSGGNDAKNSTPFLAASRTLVCRRCGASVAPRSSCDECGASPRVAGSSAREIAKPQKLSPYERARAFTLNVGAMFEADAFFDELMAFDLSDEQLHELLDLRAEQLNGQRDEFAHASEPQPASDPFNED